MTSKEFPLLKLPAEIRRNIYRFCIPHGLSVACSSKGCKRNGYADDPPQEPRAMPGLLLANRQVNAEVEQMLYESNTFEISLLSEDKGSFAVQMSLERIRKMRKIVLQVEPYGPSYSKPKQQHLDTSIWPVALRNLKYLGIVADQPVVNYPSAITIPDEDEEMDTWKQYLTCVFTYVAQTIAPTTRIVVDTNEEQFTADCLQSIFSGRCSIEELREGDEMFDREGVGFEDAFVYYEDRPYGDYAEARSEASWDYDDPFGDPALCL